jgi:outer membrane protein assembly factor BamD (BamD/ComL family)
MRYCLFNLTCLLPLAIIFNTSLCAQELSTQNKKAVKFYQDARALINQRKFDQAALLLESAVEKDSNFAVAQIVAQYPESQDSFSKSS